MTSLGQYHSLDSSARRVRVTVERSTPSRFINHVTLGHCDPSLVSLWQATTSIREFVEEEIRLGDATLKEDDTAGGFRHLERARVLGQSITADHTRIHWRMLKTGWKRRDAGEVFGQIIRIIAAATKTAFGIYPKGNAGGADL